MLSYTLQSCRRHICVDWFALRKLQRRDVQRVGCFGQPDSNVCSRRR